MRAVSWFVAVGFVAYTVPAAAQDTPKPPPPPLSEVLTGDAKSAYESARTLLNDGDFVSGAVKLQRAYDLSKEPRLLWNIAVCEKKLRHYARVQAVVTQYLTDASASLTEDDRKEAREILEAIKPFISRLTFDVDQPDATVAVDDSVVGRTPLSGPTAVDLGPHTVRITKDGFKPWTDAPTTSGGADLTITAHLVELPKEGRLVVVAATNEKIAVDGAARAIGRLDTAIVAGRHHVLITGDGKRPHDEYLTVTAGETQTVRTTLKSDNRFWYYLGIGGGGAAVVAATIIVIAIATSSSSDVPPFRRGTLDPGTIELGTSVVRWR